MASPRIQTQAKPELMVFRGGSREAASRLLAAERSKEILPILLEEIVRLGFPRALVLEVDLNTGEIKPSASLNCEKEYLARFRTSLRARENPVVSVLQNLSPAVLKAGTVTANSLYACPMIFRSRQRCWEAKHERRKDCLALLNSRLSRKYPFEKQVCTACGMRSYANIVVAQTIRHIDEDALRELRTLVDRANGFMSRLFKTEHYYNRMREMEKFAATGRLAGTIAHEINNPLESIKNAIHLLGDKLDASSKPIYDLLKIETERVTRIIRQTLDLYRNVVHLSNFDLDAVVEDTLTLFARPLSHGDIKVEKQLGHVTQFKGSADQFRQLLSNLVVNARDSMPSGGRLILRTREMRSKDGLHDSVILTVADTGAGIPQNLQRSMFDPFVSTKGSNGTGLGLWIVKGIVENHSGRIKVRSSVGKGTCFRLAFPISRELGVATVKAGVHDSTAAAAQVRRSRQRAGRNRRS